MFNQYICYFHQKFAQQQYSQSKAEDVMGVLVVLDNLVMMKVLVWLIDG